MSNARQETVAGNAAKMREALMEASIALSSATHHHLTEYDAKECLAVIESALAKPPRNCDRPECATTKAAQDVWRKEDGGQTAYYEWLFAEAKGYEKMSEKAGGIE